MDVHLRADDVVIMTTDDLAYFGRGMPESMRRTWTEWLEHYGIDARFVAVPGWVRRDETNRQIRYLAYQRDNEGNVTVNQWATDVVRVEHVLQLEAPPAPFPTFKGDHRG